MIIIENWKKKFDPFNPPTEKRCKKCKEVKSVDRFKKRDYMADGYENTCKDCLKNQDDKTEADRTKYREEFFDFQTEAF